MGPASSSACICCEFERNISLADSIVSDITDEAHRDPALQTLCSADDQRQQAAALYGSIDSLESWQIRILELQPSQDKSPLIGRLFSADLLFDGGVVESGTKNRHEYMGVSYYWGSDRATKYQLQCNGVDYPIAIEAYRALHRLRDHKKPVYVWMDTVCINQHDYEERASQVARMRSIYQNASKVVVYLGEPTIIQPSVGKSAAEFLLTLLEAHRFSKYWTGRLHAAPRDSTCDEHAEIIKLGLEELLQMRYFDRMWIIQEIWAARAVEVQYGKSTLPWQTLRALLDFSNHLRPTLRDHHEYSLGPLMSRLWLKLKRLEIGTPMQHARASMKDEPDPHLLGSAQNELDIFTVVKRCQPAECSMPHDHIYGLLGMSTTNVLSSGESTEDCFGISYTEHPTMTFTRLARYLMQRDKSIKILLLDEAFPRPQGAGNVDGRPLPSWVPDWRHSLGQPRGRLDAPPVRLPPQQNIETLSIYGFIVGTVAQCSQQDPALGAQPPIQSTEEILAKSRARAERTDLIFNLHELASYVIIRPTTTPGVYRYVGRVPEGEQELYVGRNAFAVERLRYFEEDVEAYDDRYDCIDLV